MNKLHMYCCRKDYTKAKEQLGKGKSFLKHSMIMMGIKPWNYVGVVCFPNLDKRESLKEAGALKNEDELKVLRKKIVSQTLL